MSSILCTNPQSKKTGPKSIAENSKVVSSSSNIVPMITANAAVNIISNMSMKTYSQNLPKSFSRLVEK